MVDELDFRRRFPKSHDSPHSELGWKNMDDYFRAMREMCV